MGDKASKILDEKNYVIKLISNSKLIIRLFAGVVAIFYGWLKFHGLDIGPVVSSVSTELLLKASIAIYYFSWIFGATLDGSDIEIVFQKAINKGKVPALGIFIALVVAILFLFICASWNNSDLPILLSVFWLVDYILWALFKKIMKPYFDRN